MWNLDPAYSRIILFYISEYQPNVLECKDKLHMFTNIKLKILSVEHEHKTGILGAHSPRKRKTVKGNQSLPGP